MVLDKLLPVICKHPIPFTELSVHTMIKELGLENIIQNIKVLPDNLSCYFDSVKKELGISFGLGKDRSTYYFIYNNLIHEFIHALQIKQIKTIDFNKNYISFDNNPYQYFIQPIERFPQMISIVFLLMGIENKAQRLNIIEQFESLILNRQEITQILNQFKNKKSQKLLFSIIIILNNLQSVSYYEYFKENDKEEILGDTWKNYKKNVRRFFKYLKKTYKKSEKILLVYKYFLNYLFSLK